MISTIDEPTSGEVYLSGKSLLNLSGNKLAQTRNNTLGFIFQSHYLLPEFSVLDNVLMPARISGNQKNKKEYALHLLDKVGMSHRVNYSIKKLSGGEQQRVSVARSLINQPSIIFCDEPTGNLDLKNTETLFELFSNLKSELNMTFVIVSHSDSLKKYSDRILFLEDGRMKEL